MNVLLPAPCVRILVPLVLENPSTGTRCTIDATVDTGSFATVVSSKTMEKLGLEPFTNDIVALANGDEVESKVCMCRVYLSEDEEELDVPLYVMDSDSEQALLGMDILSMGDFAASHYDDAKGLRWLRFVFQLSEGMPFI